jgi:hypothetical protein
MRSLVPDEPLSPRQRLLVCVVARTAQALLVRRRPVRSDSQATR